MKTFLVAAGVALVSSSCAASTLSFVGGTSGLLPPEFSEAALAIPSSLDPMGFASVGSSVNIFQSTQPAGNGLVLTATDPTRITITFLGSVSRFDDAVTYLGDVVLNDVDAQGTTFTTILSQSGSVPFGFQTDRGDGDIRTIQNGGAASGPTLAIGFSEIFNSGTSVLTYFSEDAGDQDFDDIVARIDVQPVPLPAGSLLLPFALAGLLAVRRLGRTQAKNAV